ncbi:MAG: hypothetical protein NVS9B4_11140 [Candidatus Acidiferrum sp.]
MQNTQVIQITNIGTAPVQLTSLQAAGGGFSISAGGMPVTLAEGASQSVTVAFAPAVVGMAQGALTISTGANDAPTIVALQGIGEQSKAGTDAPNSAKHAVKLSWSPSEGAAGYAVYRSQVSGGPYTKLNADALKSPEFKDDNVEPGNLYYYVVTALDEDSSKGNGQGDDGHHDGESGFSQEVWVQLPAA